MLQLVFLLYSLIIYPNGNKSLCLTLNDFFWQEKIYQPEGLRTKLETLLINRHKQVNSNENNSEGELAIAGPIVRRGLAVKEKVGPDIERGTAEPKIVPLKAEIMEKRNSTNNNFSR